MLKIMLFVFGVTSPLFSFSQIDKKKIPLFPIFTTFFEIGKSQLTEPQMENLRTYVISNIRTLKDSNYCIQICGHTDASGNKKMNLELSRKRALSVSEFIIKNGVSEKKIKTECSELIKHENSLSLKTKRNRQNNHLSRFVVVRIDKEN
jgi:hypothetical protein